MNSKIIKQHYRIRPTEVKFVGPVCTSYVANTLSVVDGYQVNVKFKGNLIPVISNKKLARKNELLPRRSEVVLHIYAENEDMTYIWYVFYPGLFDAGQIRAIKFKDRIQSKIDLLKRNENIK